MSNTPMPMGSLLPVLTATISVDNSVAGQPPVPISLVGLVAVSFVMTIYNVNTKTDQTGAGTFTIVDAVNGVVQYTWAAADVAVAGTYQLFISVPQAGGPRIMDPIPFTVLPK